MPDDVLWSPYCGAAPAPTEWLLRWNFDPVVLLALGLLAAVALTHEGRQRLSGLAAVLVLAVAFVSPLCALSSALFSARVTHHVLLVGVAAPLLAAALGRWRPPGGVLFWTIAHGAVFWIWHAPPVYAAALSHDATYWLMQATLGLSAVAFWSRVQATSAPNAIAALLLAMVQMGLLGALITFAGTPLFAPHLATTAAWGLHPLEDQQLAGLIMWAPASALYLAAAVIRLGRFLGPDPVADQVA